MFNYLVECCLQKKVISADPLKARDLNARAGVPAVRYTEINRMTFSHCR